MEDSHHSRNEDDDSLVLSEASISGVQAAQIQQDEDEERQNLARKETQAVTWLRVAVFVVLVATAVLVSTGVYLLTRNNEETDFENQYYGYADRVVNAFASAVERKLGALDALATTITSYARATGAEFPFVTLPDFEIRGANTRILSDTEYIFWLPLVTDEKRDEWIDYANKTQGWFADAYYSEVDQIARQDAFFQLPHVDLPPNASTLGVEVNYMTPFIFNHGLYAPAPQGSGPFLVYWQITPVFPFKPFLNFNLMSHPLSKESLSRVLERGLAVTGKAYDLETRLEGEESQTQAINDWTLYNGQYRHQADEFNGLPVSRFGYPVFDSFEANRTIVGALDTNLFWGEYFRNILPENAGEVIAVMENTINQTFTFSVSGTSVQYIGNGDLHDPKYDHMEVVQNVAEYVRQRAKPSSRAYTTVDLDYEFNVYTLRVYPSAQMEDDALTNKPMIYTIVVLSVFLFTSSVFITYDCLVERRQRIVLGRAIKSGAIVSSLFPKNVRERLYQDEENKTTKTEKKGWLATSGGNGVNKFLESGSGDEPIVSAEAPIAELFPETTVLFADLAGFTAWSASRAPTEVFEFLETIYRAFDALALRRRVFKIETIGDCYVAVTGLPQPQEDHAVIMVRFATDCLIKFNELVTDQLVDKFGSNTSELGLRIGLNSGPVTAGVLRGQKSRFQLFGDTVNTTQRIETNGHKGRIHVSASTAEQLRARGKSHWLQERADIIHAKGKGEMQTYWVEVRTSKTSQSTHSQSSTATPPMTISEHAPALQMTNMTMSDPEDHEDLIENKAAMNISAHEGGESLEQLMKKSVEYLTKSTSSGALSSEEEALHEDQ